MNNNFRSNIYRLVFYNTSPQNERYCRIYCCTETDFYDTKSVNSAIAYAAYSFFPPASREDFFCVGLKLPILIYDALQPEVPEDITKLKKRICPITPEEDDILNQYLKIAKKINEKFSHTFGEIYDNVSHGILVNCDLAFDVDFWVIFSTSLGISEIEFHKQFQFICKFLCPQNLDPNFHDPFKQVLKIKDSVSSHAYTPHKRRYSNYISRLNDLYDSSSRANRMRRCQCALLSALLLRTQSAEIKRRFLSINTGAAILEEAEDEELYNGMTCQLFDSLDEFLSQASDESPAGVFETNRYTEILWANLFAIQTLFTIFTDCEDLNVLEKNCGGLYPLFKDISAVNSEYPMQFANKYVLGFLYLPKDNPNLWDYFPALIHEIHHYIPTLNRRERNKAIFYLILLAVLKSAIDIEACRADPQAEIKFYRFSYTLCNELYAPFEEYCNGIPWYKGNLTDVEIDLNNDSMSYADNMREYLYFIDFNRVYSDVHLRQNSPLQFIDHSKCVDEWRKKAVDYMHTFISLIREVHSDLCMLDLLNMNLKEYLVYMASEKTFTRLSAKTAASSSIIRLCLISRYLYISENPSCADLENWQITCKKILNNIPSLAKNQSDNLISYLNEYYSKNEEHIGISPFREDIETVMDCLFMGSSDADKMNSNVYGKWKCISNRDAVIHNKEKCAITCIPKKSWIYLINNFRENPDWKVFSDIYRQCFTNKESNAQENHLINFRTKVVFRDLFNWFDVDEW